MSARFARATGELLQQFLQRPIGTRQLVVCVDAIYLGAQAILVALGVDGAGRKQVLGLREGSTENAAVTVALLEDLAARGCRPSRGCCSWWTARRRSRLR